MKNIFKNTTIAFMVIIAVGCSDALTTGPSVEISDNDVLNSVPQLNKVLTSTYRQLYFNSDGGGSGDRVYAGIPGFQMYVDLGGSDILCTENMGSNQLTCYRYIPAKTQGSQENTGYLWRMCYNVINHTNIILTNIDAADGIDTDKDYVKGQALAMRALMYFHLIQNYQQTYVIAQNKRGVILRTSANDNVHKGFSTVAEVYSQIVTDLTEAKSLLANFTAPNLWTINSTICSGILARVYLVMQNWEGAYNEAKIVYDRHSTLMTRDQYRDGFDKMISSGYPEVAWAMKYTDDNNVGGSTQFNFWYNQDPSYGEGFNEGPIYAFLTFFVDSKFYDLFEQSEDRYQFWKRTQNASTHISSKWAFDKYKHYGNRDGAVGGDTRPEVCLMRGSEMLLIMAEATAKRGNATEAQTLLNRLQTARGVTNLTSATGDQLLEAIYIERRKELICEGQTGLYDLLRLQRRLVRQGVSNSNPAGHYQWGLDNLNGYVATAEEPSGFFDSNDYRLLCQIPAYEILRNEAISEEDQNPFSGQ